MASVTSAQVKMLLKMPAGSRSSDRFSVVGSSEEAVSSGAGRAAASGEAWCSEACEMEDSTGWSSRRADDGPVDLLVRARAVGVGAPVPPVAGRLAPL